MNDVLSFELFRLGDASVTVATLATALGIVLGGWVASRLIQKGARRGWARQVGKPDGLFAVLRLLHYAIMIVAVAVALETIGVDLSTLFAAGAILAIGLGFAMQSIAQNFVAGVILLMERTIKPGDLLEVEGTIVRVQQMGLRATLVRTRSDEEMIVPNAVLVQSTIKNFTLHDPLYRVRTTVGVSYQSDLKVVAEVLEQAARAVPERHAAKEPVILLTQFGDNAVQYEVSVWTDNAWVERLVLSSLNQRIWWALKDAGVTIAFPQRDVHLDAAVLDLLRGRERQDEA